METRATHAIRGYHARGFGEGSAKARTYGVGRTCAIEGCGTLLSAYNPSHTCALHEGRWHEEVQTRTRRSQGSEEVTRRCAFEGCGREFTTTNRAKRYCRDACRMKAFQARMVLARRDEHLDPAERSS